jgi:acyl-CoA thioester hydrolase
MGIVHHSSYLLYLEEARVAYLAAIGYPYERLRQEGTDFAVIEVQVRYVIPLLFDDVVAITLTLSEAKGATFVIDYTLRRTESVVATARTRHGAIGANRRPKRLPTWMLALGGRG